MSVGQKMLKVMEAVRFITFDGKNKSQNYKYASAAGIIHQIHRAFEDAGLTVSTGSEVLNYQALEGKDAGKYVCKAVVKETLIVIDPEDGSQLVWSGVGEGMDWGDKAVMKASTAAYKYALAHGLLLGWGAVDPEDDAKEAAAQDKEAARLKKAIASAKTVAKLEECRAGIGALRGHKDFEGLKEAFGKKKEKLEK